jgi:hypothetical protein
LLDLSWMDTVRVGTPPNEQKGAIAPRIGEKGYTILDRDKQAREASFSAYAAYQQNIKISEALRAEILKGLAAGEGHTVILEKAIRCIGLMTHDTVFAQNAANML